jgi:hypothetical protein
MCESNINMTAHISLSRKTVTKSFHDLVYQTYPALADRPAYRRMMEFILFGTAIDEETKQLIISQEMLAAIEDKQAQLGSRHYCAERFLEAFGREVAPIRWSDWSKKEARARVLLDIDLTPEVRAAHRHEIENKEWHGQDRIYFTSGKAFTRKTQTKIREEDRTNALELLQQAGCEEARVLLDYLNHLPSNRFQKMLSHIDEAVLESFKIDNELVRTRQMNILRAIVDQPLPLYRPTSRSVRLFAYNECVALLKGSIRDVLVQDWQGFDLRSAQLAICAREWPVEAVQRFLEARGSIWNSLYEHFKIEPNQEAKDTFKTALYAIVFGGGSDRIRRVFEEGNMDEAAAQHFLQHPIIAAMWRARKRVLAQITQKGGAVDCFGRWITIPRELGVPNPRSVLAQLAQARELQLLYPVVELARTTDEFTIALYLFDGVWIDFKDATKKDRWTRRIVDAVNGQARELGIATELEKKS